MSGINKSAAEAFLNQRKQQKQEDGQGKKKFESDVLWFSLPKEECEVIMRFLPPREGQEIPGKLVSTHWDIPLQGKGENKAASLVPFLGADKCPIEKVLRKYRDVLNTEKWEAQTKFYTDVLVKSVKIKKGNNFVEVLKDEKNVPYNPKVPRVLGTYGDFNLQWLLEKTVDPEIGDITSPTEGYWVKFTRKEAGGKWERTVLPYSKAQVQSDFGMAIGSSEEEIAEIVAQIHDLDKIWKAPDDALVKRCNKAAAALEDMFKDMLSKEEKRERELAPDKQREREMGANADSDSETPSLTTRQGEAAKTAKAPKAEAPAKAPAAEAPKKPAGKVPNGAPDCFADSAALYAGHESEDAAEDAELTDAQKKQLAKCRECVFETDCAERLGRG
jgi:hypothetical protein